ncbi:helix-turn-helix transcriptional regulator [Saccharopolyspora elongata]|uniref:HTH luxR-type domain-containing protein n=1 Tax=Saccharopolyspora elongata TaxID=2530387 RepID=A0A4R4YAK3_9PSEU|nr:AAA family ATPase [Saccharopolyspora elongata]TDD41555.1 hypothetical protein E1288_32300 [Saccharopolyspora elongata]
MGKGKFVGRLRELAILDNALRTAGTGEAQFVVLSGDAGTGKTRLLEHFAARAEQAGARVLRSACIELGAEGLPLAPVTAVLRALVDDAGPESVTDLLPGAGALLRLLPELGVPSHGHDSQAHLFDLFGALLRRLGRDDVVVLAIDDLQWADRSTRELLGLLVRTLRASRVLIAAAYRSEDVGHGHPLRPFLAELELLPAVHRFEVGRFSRAETSELIEVVLGAAPSQSVLDQVFRRSGGNAFFARALASAPAGDAVPESLRDVLVHRIERLRPPADRVVRLAAIGGQHVSHALLAAVADIEEGDLLAAVRVAAKASVLRVDPRGYAFGHRLLREAVVDDLLPAERARLHLAYAEALGRTPDLVPQDRLAAQTAFHWYEAGKAAEALPALLRAASEAERIYAHAEQVQMLDRALRLPESVPVVDRLPLFEKAIAAATWGGEYFKALDLIDRALAETDRTREPAGTAMLFAHRGMIMHNLNRDGSLAAVGEALEILPRDRSVARARVLVLAGAVLAGQGRHEHAHELVEEAASIAGEHGAAELEANARVTLGRVLNQAGRYEEGMAALRSARELVAEDSDPLLLVRVHLNLAVAGRSLGDHEAVIDAARAGLGEDAAGVGRTLGMQLAACLGAALFAVGRWDEADEVCRRSIALDPAGVRGAPLHLQRAEIALARGADDRARSELSLARTLLDQPSQTPNLSVARLEAELALSDERVDDAREVVVASLRGDPGSAPPDVWPLLTTAARVDARITMRARMKPVPDPDATVADLVRSAVTRLPADTPLFSAFADQVAAELGEPTSWTRVAMAWDELGSAQPAAYARMRAAETALRSGDVATAGQLLCTAEKQALQLGAMPLLEEVRTLARSARIKLGRDADAPTSATALERIGLTERETEVLRLVTIGRSNRQIGEELFISPKTVSVHVTHLLEKLGVANRGEAAAAAHRLRLFNHEQGVEYSGRSPG